jgi:hypothetical protein
MLRRRGMTKDKERFSIQDVAMHVVGSSRLLAAGAIAVLLASATGCLPSVENSSAAQSPAPEAKSRTPVEEPGPTPRPPAPEFQQPLALPPTEPPPKLPAESLDGSPPKSTAPPAKPVAPAEKLASSRDKLTAPSGKTAPKAPPTKVPRKPFDPIVENGPIFQGWPKPKVAIAITGMEQGYIEPCGCAGIERMTGGMSRRYALFQALRNKKGWPLVALDVGDLAKGFGREAEIKFRTLVESKDKAGYNAVAFGPNDLRLPAAELVSVAAEVNGKPSIFLSANVGLFGFDQNVTQTSRIVKAGGMRIGVTAVLGKQYQNEIAKHQKENDSQEIETCDAEAALRKIVPELKQNSDYLVLLANATRDEAKELAKKFPEFNAVVVSEGPDLPPSFEPEKVSGMRTLLITVGHKGMAVIVLGLYDGEPAVRYQRVLLDSRFDLSADSKRRAAPEMKALMTGYQDQLRELGFAGLGLNPAANPLAESNGRYVGSQKCESCHEESYDVWKRSRHRHAYETLEAQDPPRNFDPECVSCHVVGWHPTKFFPYRGGFETVKKTPHLKNVGCEDCHGPGEKHLVAEDGHDEQLKKKYQLAMRVTKEQAKKEQCTTCHDIDNSPEFNFEKYWPLVEHHEKNQP